jgi:glutamate formiminotransferase
MSLVECVPNFSEGRRPQVIAAIRDAIAAVEGTVILDVSSDASHNRTVVTFVAPVRSAAEAAFAGIAKATELIDLTRHEGEHPRLGATDVCPFIPLEGTSMEDCIVLARTLGERVGKELGIPVFLYERAATRPDRVNLADIRRGEFELARTTPPPAPPSSAPAPSSSPSTSTSATARTSPSRRPSQRRSAAPPAASRA